MLVRLVEREDGGVSIIRAVAEEGAEINEATALDRIETAQAGQPELAGRPSFDVDESALPADRTERARWRIIDGAVAVVGEA